MTKKDILALGLAIIIVLFVVNFLSSRHFLRTDLTQDNEYTLSDSTKQILKGLEDVVNIRLYFSKDLPPALMRLKRGIDDILDEYRTYAGRYLNVQYIDPTESPQKEQQVQVMGIPPVQVNVIERDKQQLVKLYLGIAVVHEDRKEILPVVQTDRNLEYDLTSAILKVSKKEMPQIVWWSTGEDKYKSIKEFLKRRYRIRDVADDLELDPGKDALLVMAVNEELSNANIFSVDQYLMKGGKVILMSDSVQIEDNLQTSLVETNLGEFIKSYNVAIKDKLLVDRANTHAAFSGGFITYQVPYPYWVRVDARGFDPENPVVSELDSLILPWTSPVELLEGTPPDVDVTILARSSPFNRETGLEESLYPENASKLLGRERGEPKPLVVLLNGRLKSYYSDEGHRPPVTDSEPTLVAENATLMVIGNSRFVQDNFLRQFRANSIFFENAADFMAMGNQLIGIRSKGMTSRPIDELSTAGKGLAKYLNVFGTPLVLILIGLGIIVMRRKRMRTLQAAYR